jgi:hypothetical protein
MARRKTIMVGDNPVTVKEDQILRFQEHIEEMMANGCDTVMEAICQYCEEQDIEPESVKNLISMNLLGKIKQEAIERKMVSGLDTRNVENFFE